MKNVMGIISLSDNNQYLSGLVRFRPIASVPFGGRYRVIDFILSSMVNSGVRNVGVVTQNKHRSIIDHLRSGKDWDLDRKRDGLFILTPEIDSCANLNKGVLQNIYDNFDYINHSKQKYVIITEGDVICNLDFNKAFEYHLNTNADITVLYKDMKNTDNNYFLGTEIKLTDEGRVVDMKVNRQILGHKKISMDMFIMEKNLLMDLVDACVSRGYYNFIKDALIRNISMLDIYGYPYTGYMAKIYSLQSYYHYNMDLLNNETRKSLFYNPGFVYTKVKDGPPTKYMFSSKVSNSLVANNCVIEGKVENSILFRGVKVAKGAHIKNSILMQKTVIEQNALVENTITDKEVRITKDRHIRGEKNYPIYIEKKMVI
ncbi:glucose-1-phosphate adenylyltransferase subunit GlgD [Desulfofalx alkaliphila]|uniref:glucose-1-phosphate adenylyltransferase subunit GlgD n=1 Tax=Desulfofalx alkaliphila TaxID=105483 RepID=UPI0004E11279|nr:glucose-1-phosphate adenylyltransferase subunit GlgD [Desulfofalx alkaliphila]